MRHKAANSILLSKASTSGTGRANSTGQLGRHPTADHPLDFYETPPRAITALLRAERLPELVVGACAGNGAIARLLRAAGHHVVASDIVDATSRSTSVPICSTPPRPPAVKPSSPIRRSKWPRRW